jgi:methylenetetrahydrofolate dehydrogenase (NADP+)/methenyltetrahydrofolate cyclohydrolase
VHSKIPRETIGKLASESDIVILASGQRGLVLPEEIRSHQVIIDCGYQDDGKGDLGFVPDCAAYTPVPGGVGPVTIACLVENALRLHSKQK